jgi:hypothetical protein
MLEKAKRDGLFPGVEKVAPRMIVYRPGEGFFETWAIGVKVACGVDVHKLDNVGATRRAPALQKKTPFADLPAASILCPPPSRLDLMRAGGSMISGVASELPAESENPSRNHSPHTRFDARPSKM